MQRHIRTAIVTLITLFLLIASFAGIIMSKHYQDLAASEYDISKCGKVEITMTEAFVDYQLPKDKQSGMLGCYCFGQLKKIGFAVKDLVFPNQEKLCVDWLQGYSLSNAMAQSTAIGISVLNGIIVTILVLLSEF